MTRVIYVNGQYHSYGDARVHAEDRGFQFGDAVYEVCEIRNGAIVDETRHMDRLSRSLGELQIAEPMTRPAWSRVLRETVRRNRVQNGLIYLQVSRGAGPRDFLFAGVTTGPTVVCLARAVPQARQEAAAARGISVKSVPEMRWGRCDIKTVMLLPASLAKEAARAEGAQEAWFVDDAGHVREGGSSNAWIVTRNDELVTPPANRTILRGVTRTTLIDLIEAEGLKLVERAFTIEEAQGAREAFITSATNLLMPVVRIDDRSIGNGQPGEITQRLRGAFHQMAELNEL